MQLRQSLAEALGAASQFNEEPLTRSQQAATEKGAVNMLEDMALTQTMFEEGKLIWHGEAEEFVNIIRKSRSSIQNMQA